MSAKSQAVRTASSASVRTIVGRQSKRHHEEPDGKISMEDLETFGYLSATLAPRAAPKRAARDEIQVQIDVRVAEVHLKWHEEGCETVWLRCPQAFYAVPHDKAKALQDMIRKSGRLGVRVRDVSSGVSHVHPVQIRFGVMDPPLYDERGLQIVSFTVLDKKDGAGEDDDLGHNPRDLYQLPAGRCDLRVVTGKEMETC